MTTVADKKTQEGVTRPSHGARSNQRTRRVSRQIGARLAPSKVARTSKLPAIANRQSSARQQRTGQANARDRSSVVRPPRAEQVNAQATVND